MKISRHERLLKLAIHKIKKHDGRVWCGYLTPCEIRALVRVGVIFRYSHEDTVRRIDSEIKKGLCSPTWFYFQLSKPLAKKVGAEV
jgi:hypothetical protein